MKRLISVLLICALLVTAAILPAQTGTDERAKAEKTTPIVFVTGIGQSVQQAGSIKRRSVDG